MCSYKDAILKIRNSICCERPVQHFCTDDCKSGTFYCPYAMYAMEKRDEEIARFVDYHFAANSPDMGDGAALLPRYKCPSCGRHIYKRFDDIRFCAYCGKKIKFEVTE